MAEISLQEYYDQIEAMIDQGRYAEAIAHGKHILGTYPKCVAVYRLLGRAMLEARQDDHASDMFLRVLSADPEDLLSWVAMSEIYERRDDLNATVWCLERAFELSVDNQLVGEELRQLYGRRDGVEPERVELTGGALARLYLRGDLLSRAVGEFRALLKEQPERADLEVALAEALWRNEQRLEASEVCQKILDKLLYCLKANLILGEIWVNSGREEGQTCLRRAEALDPGNKVAQALFGDASPLPAQAVQVAPLEYRPPTVEERPAWMSGVELVSTGGPPLTDREAALVDIAAALEAQIEIPSWLEEIDVGEAGVEPAVPELAALMEEPSECEEPAPVPAEQIPEWLAGVGEGPELFAGEEETVSEVPDWLAGLSAESIGGEKEPGEGETPDFLAEIGAGKFVEEAAPAEEVPDWLAGLREQVAEEEMRPPEEPVLSEAEGPVPSGEELAPAEIPDWLQKLAPSEAEEPVPSAGEAAAPSWLEGGEMPSGEEALAWLEQLASGKEEELQAQVEAEIEVRTAEIMGRPKPEKPVVEAPPVEEAPAPAPAEIPGWMQELAPSELPPSEAEKATAAPPVEAAAPTPAEIPVPGMAEEAFGWTAFGEFEAAPEVEEAAAPPVEAAAPTPAEIPVPGMAEEAFGWTAFGEFEAAPEVEEAAAPPVEEVMAEAVAAPLTEELVPSIVEEIVAPPVVEEAKAPLAVEYPVVEKAPAPPAPPPVIEKPVAPRVEAVTPAAAPARPRPKPPKPLVADPFAAQQAYLKENPRDYDARLELARALWQVDRREEALEAYDRLVRAGKSLDFVIAELEEYSEQWPDVGTQRVLGDAYMKSGQLEKALELYRQALENL
jgi:tetratricopeptide (TPR) repeat protein